MTDKEKLLALIAAYGPKQQQFADHIHVSQNSVANWIARNRISAPAYNAILKYCKNVSREWLEGTSEEMYCMSEAKEKEISPCYENITKLGEQEAQDQIRIPGVVVDAFLVVTDNQCAPAFKEGDLLGLHLAEIDTVQDKKAYALLSEEGGNYLRFMSRNNEDEDIIDIWPSGNAAVAIKFPKKIISQLYEVVWAGGSIS